MPTNDKTEKTIHMTSIMMLFIISAATIIEVSSAALVSLQHANALSNDDKTSSCGHHLSDISKKCSKKDTPFILPFP
jgi:hypothetical protein